MKEQIKYLICPKCKNSFYINARFADKGYTWLCPKCRHNFTEKESGNDKLSLVSENVTLKGSKLVSENVTFKAKK